MHQRALQFVRDGDTIGLGSGRAANEFVRELGRSGRKVRGVPTSEATAALARECGIELVSLDAGMPLALTVDGADEVDPHCNLIKGYGRALVREKIVAAASRQFVILVGQAKLVATLGSRGRLPVEVLPLAVPLFLHRLGQMGLSGTLDVRDNRPFRTDNGNAVVDVQVTAIPEPAELDAALRAIPGVVGTGIFAGMASLVLVGDVENGSTLLEERPAPRGTA